MHCVSSRSTCNSITIFVLTIMIIVGTNIYVFAQEKTKNVKNPSTEQIMQQLSEKQQSLEKGLGKKIIRYKNSWAIADEIIIKYKKSTDRRRRTQALSATRLESIHSYKVFRDFELVRVPKGKSLQETIEDLKKYDYIDIAEPNFIIEVPETKVDVVDGPSGNQIQPNTSNEVQPSSGQYFPNDPYFPDQWALHNTGTSQFEGVDDADIDAPEVWTITKGSPNVVVAVIDTGVEYTHDDLKNQMWVNEAELNGSEGVDDDENGYVDDIYGYDFANLDGDPLDDHFHGTHCAGIIAAEQDNNIGCSGLAPNVKIMALKFMGASGGGTIGAAIGCFEYASVMNADITSNSWGSTMFSEALVEAIEEYGKPTFCAAGNNSSDNDEYPYFPTNITTANNVSVLATNSSDIPASFSNYGKTTVDVGAPGDLILSCYLDNRYAYASGTSMATPYVSALAALIKSQYPQDSTQELIFRVISTGDPLDSLADLCVTERRINANSAFGELNYPPVVTDLSISGNIQTGSTLTASYTYSDREGDLEDVTTIKWFVADNAGGYNKTLVAEGTDFTYTPTNTDGGLYISFELEPTAQSGNTIGFSTNSGWVGPIDSQYPIIKTFGFPAKSNDYITICGTTVGSGGTMQERGVVYSTSPNASLSDSSATASLYGDFFTAALSGLQADTLYYFRLYAVNENGTTYGREYSLKTLPAVNDYHLFVPYMDAKGTCFGNYINAKNNTLVIQAPTENNGSVYIYRYDEANDIWMLEHKLEDVVIMTPDAVVVSMWWHHFTATNGDYVFITSDRSNTAKILKRDSTTGLWSVVQQSSGAGDKNSGIKATSDTAVFSYNQRTLELAPYTGNLKIYKLNGTSGLWELDHELVQGSGDYQSQFGYKFDINDNFIAVANNYGQKDSLDHSVFIYDASTYAQIAEIQDPFFFGQSQFGFDIALEGNNLFVKCQISDRIYFYHYIIDKDAGTVTYQGFISRPEGYQFITNAIGGDGWLSVPMRITDWNENEDTALFTNYQNSSQYYVTHLTTYDDVFSSDDLFTRFQAIDSRFVFTHAYKWESSTSISYKVAAFNYKTTNSRPGAVNLNISGETTVESILTANYDYVDIDSDPQDSVSYQWYRSDQQNCIEREAISGATSQTYTLDSADLGSYISVGITVSATSGNTQGIEVLSQPTGQITGLYPSVTTDMVISYSATSAICSGSASLLGGDAITARGIAYSTSENPTTADSTATSGSGEGNFSAALTGLSAETKYYFRAYAVNSAGTTYGQQQEFTTLSTNTSDARKISAPDAAVNDQFGKSVAMYGDYLAAGAIYYEESPEEYDRGAVYIYKNDGSGNWLYHQMLLEVPYSTGESMRNDRFGYEISMDGQWIFVDSFYSFYVYVFKFNETSGYYEFDQFLKCGEGDGNYGNSMQVNGDVAIVGESMDSDQSFYAGAAFIYRYNSSNGIWEEEIKFFAADVEEGANFGHSVAIENNRAVVSAYIEDVGDAENTGAVYILEYADGSWTHTHKLSLSNPTGEETFGTSVALLGDYVIVGARTNGSIVDNGGAIHIYKYNSGEDTWSLHQEFYSDRFAYLGHDVFVNSNWLFASAPSYDSKGTVFIYKLDSASGTWVEAGNVLSPNSVDPYGNFGESLGGYQDYLAVGANFTDADATDAGAVYLFDLSNINAPPFASSVSIAGSAIVGETLTGSYTYSDFESDTEGATTVQWYKSDDQSGTNRTAISGATGATYIIQMSDLGKYLSFGVTPLATSGPSPGNEYFSNPTDQVSSNLPFVTKPDLINYSSSQATCTSEASLYGGTEITDRGFVWATTSTPTLSNDSVSCGTGTGEFSATLESLTPDTTYYIRSYATNSSGTSYSEETTMKTLPSSELSADKILSPDVQAGDRFGQVVSISGDYMVVGAVYHDSPFEDCGAAYIFQKDQDGNWNYHQKLTPSNAASSGFFANSVEIQDEWLFVSHLGRFEIVVFKLNSTTKQWEEFQHLDTIGTTSSGFGTSMSLDGNRVAIGSPNDSSIETYNGTAYLFEYNSTSEQWEEKHQLVADDASAFAYFGQSVFLSGNTLLVGSYRDSSVLSNAGSAYIFEKDGDSWVQTQKLTNQSAAENDNFGTSVAINGDVAIVGEPNDDENDSNSGSIYVYLKGDTQWDFNQQESSTTSAKLGSSLDSTEKYLAAGGPLFSNNAGKVEIYKYDGASKSYSPFKTLSAPDQQASDYFGSSVSIDNNLVLVGAYGDDDQGSSSGSVYLFELPETNFPPFASSVSVTGNKQVGSVLTGSYTYNDSEDDPEGNSVIKWYRADDASGTNQSEISGENNLTYTSQIDDVDKYIAFSITTVAQSGDSPGSEQLSDWYGPITSVVVNYSISVAGSGAGSGTITSSPGGINATWDGSTTSGTASASFVAPGPVSLTATPAQGSSFAGWSGDASGTDTSTSVTLDGNKNVVASFTLDVGSLTVTISPQEAIDAGAQWRRTGTSTWYDSGATESDVPIGSHTVEFSDVSGWTKPANQSVTISKDTTASASGTYTEDVGSLSVTISPQEAIDAGAQWRRTGTSTWYDSGATESDVPVGSHTIEFSDVSNWTKPANQSVTVSKDTTASASGTYTFSGLALSAASAECAAGEQTSIDISLSAGDGIEAFGFDLVFDSTKLTLITPVAKGSLVTESFTFDSNLVDANTLRIGGLDSGGGTLNAGAGTVAVVTFEVKEGLAEDTSIPLTITNLTDDILNAQPVSGQITVSECAINYDINGDGSVTPGDALIVFKHYLGIATITDPCQLQKADANGDDSITPGDALIVFKEYLGLN